MATVEEKYQREAHILTEERDQALAELEAAKRSAVDLHRRIRDLCGEWIDTVQDLKEDRNPGPFDHAQANAIERCEAELLVLLPSESPEGNGR